MVSNQDMVWEAKEFDRAVDYVNVLFGALLSAYLGVVLSQSPGDGALAARVCFMLGLLAIIGLNWRSISHSLLHGIETVRHSIVATLAIVASILALRSLFIHTGIGTGALRTILLCWAITAVVITIGIIARRWIKIYE